MLLTFLDDFQIKFLLTHFIFGTVKNIASVFNHTKNHLKNVTNIGDRLQIYFVKNNIRLRINRVNPQELNYYLRMNSGLQSGSPQRGPGIANSLIIRKTPITRPTIIDQKAPGSFVYGTKIPITNTVTTGGPRYEVIAFISLKIILCFRTFQKHFKIFFTKFSDTFLENCFRKIRKLKKQ